MSLRSIGSALGTAAAISLSPAAGALTLTHVHGLAYSGDGKRLMIPSHHGLALYEAGKWSKAPGPQHDYMGFSATATRLYSSGHPASRSGLVNPFGLIRSTDGGRTWDRLGLEGETDFHVLATSWKTNAVYVWNPKPSSRIRKPGLNYTLNDGFVWKSAQAAGLQGEPRAIAVHPEDAKTVAVATSRGIYESTDWGNTFKQVAGGEGTTAFFDLDGRTLWYATFESGARLATASVQGGSAKPVALPPLDGDAVAYIAQNPAARFEYAIATFRRDVCVTKNAGASWNAIARSGETR